VSAEQSDWDVIIVGAGPAGLSAALILGRCRRRVLICDRGTPRSWASHAMHGYVSRDGIPPEEFRREAHEELARYSSVSFRAEAVVTAQRMPGPRFKVLLEGGESASARKLLLATGVMDELPQLPGLERYFGVSIFSCPYCDGWEMRDLPIAVYGRGSRGFEMARAMTAWTQNILLCTNGPARLTPSQRAALSANDVAIDDGRIEALEGEGGQLAAIRFAGGRVTERRALFFDTPCHPQSELASALGCEMTASGAIRCGRYEASTIPGVFIAGNILKNVQLSIVAAGEGAQAAFGINRALTREDFDRRAGALQPLDHPGPQ
jgi:thioredoxin reductase